MSTSRSYTSPSRESDAAQTRARIVDAAALLFARDGYGTTPLRAIAAEAAVSVQSVHLAGPKSALLLAAFERTFAGDEGSHPLTERPELAAIMATPSSEVALDRYAAFITRRNAVSGAIWRAFRAAADSDPAVHAAFQDLDTRRRRDVGQVGGWLAARGLVLPERADEVADEFGFLTQPDTYQYFADTGWSTLQCERWLRRGMRDAVAAGSD